MSHERTWRKSSYSNDTIESACVEVSLAATVTPSVLDSAAALVRDSKATQSHVLAFSASAWAAFVASVA